MEQKPFHIFQLTKELSARYAGETGKPHRHDYEEIIIISKGNPCHFIDFNREKIEPPVVIYVAQGKIHKFIPDTDTEGWAIRYQNEFIPQSRFHFYSNFADTINYRLDNNNCLENLLTLCRMMQQEYSTETPDYNMIRYLLLALLSKLETDQRSRIKENGNANHTQIITFNNFLKIVEENYKRPLSVDFYAEKLNMSARNLNLICQAVFNKSVSEIVETRKLIEARQLLINSSLTVSEIGYELGYNEKAYFTRVFSKKTGLTPTEFRAQMQAMLS